MAIYEPNKNISESIFSNWTLIWILLSMRSFYKIKILKLELKLLTIRPNINNSDNVDDEKEPQNIITDYKYP